MFATPRFSPALRRTTTGLATCRSTRLRSTATASDGTEEPPHLRIVAVNDVYELHMLPKLKTLVRSHKQQQQQRGGIVLTTLAGDFVSPSILSGMDQGQSIVHALGEVPVTHACFGNHEADLKLNDLARRVAEFTSRGGRWLNSNLPGFAQHAKLPRWDIVDIPSAGLQVGVLGLLTSEPGIFRKDTFRGLPIDDVVASAEACSALLRERHGVAAVIALTHQSLAADLELSRSGAVDLILGGHEHEVMLERPTEAEGTARGCPVVKAGSDALTAAVVDVRFGAVRSGVRWRNTAAAAARGGQSAPAPATQPRVPLSIDVRFEDVDAHEPEPSLQAEVDTHLGVLRALETEAVCSAVGFESLAGLPLSSCRTRFEQTTVGTLLASTLREALQTQVAMVNGGSIKGNTTYEPAELTYLALQRELPFPTKMVVVAMPGAVLDAAVRHSRAGEPTKERRAYLQLDDGVGVEVDGDGGGGGGDGGGDHRVVSVGGVPFDAEATYSVAVPRNLLKGAFEIAPLVEWAAEHAASLPDEDAFVPALNLILHHNASQIWRRLGSFDDLDLDGDGELTRDEIVAGLAAKFGGEPSAVMVDNVMRALDADGDGTISREEHARLGKPPLPAPPAGEAS